jgi:hypothetical protein
MFAVESDDVRSECFCTNVRYAFELRKDKTNRPWYLKTIHPSLNSPGARRFLSSNLGLSEEGDAAVHQGPFLLYNRSVRSLSKEKDFELVKCCRVMAGQTELVKIEFRFRNHESGVGLYRFEKGWFVLNPAKRWSVVRFEGSCVFPGGSPKAFVRGAHEYEAEANGFPVVKTSLINVDLSGNRQPLTFNEKIEYIIDKREPAEEEFTLSAFGFNEPRNVPRSRSFAFLGFIATAMAILVVGWYFRRRMLLRRAKAANAAQKGPKEA